MHSSLTRSLLLEETDLSWYTSAAVLKVVNEAKRNADKSFNFNRPSKVEIAKEYIRAGQRHYFLSQSFDEP